MDTTITMRNSKAEMLEHIRALELRLTTAAHDAHHMRTRISVLEGTAALKEPAAPQQVRLNGLLHNVIVERRGQSTTKRYALVPGQGV